MWPGEWRWFCRREVVMGWIRGLVIQAGSVVPRLKARIRMTVTQYETRFIDLARQALIILPIERERVERFIDGLIQPIRLQMVSETGSEISFQEADNVARRVEIVLSQGGGHGSDKRPNHSGGSVVPRLEAGIRMVEAILLGPISQHFRFLTALQVVVDLTYSILISSPIVHHQLLSVHCHCRVFGVVI